MIDAESKKKTIQQKINKLKEKEAKLTLQERKKRTQKLIELGGLIQKAGLAHLSSNQMFGALLSLKDKLNDIDQITKWEKQGGQEFSSTQKKSESKTGVILKFEKEPQREIRQKLRSLGLRWNTLRQEWEGIVDFDRAQKIAESNGGKIQHLSA